MDEDVGGGASSSSSSELSDASEIELPLEDDPEEEEADEWASVG